MRLAERGQRLPDLSGVFKSDFVPNFEALNQGLAMSDGDTPSMDEHPYPEYSRANSYPWSPFSPEAGPSRTRF